MSVLLILTDKNVCPPDIDCAVLLLDSPMIPCYGGVDGIYIPPFMVSVISNWHLHFSLVKIK